jgi:hypothetical protein
VSDALEQTIVDLLADRDEGKTICPSEAARAVGGDDWRELMPAAREAAARLAGRGAIEVTQRGEPVDALTARGPIRLGHPRS